MQDKLRSSSAPVSSIKHEIGTLIVAVINKLKLSVHVVYMLAGEGNFCTNKQLVALVDQYRRDSKFLSKGEALELEIRFRDITKEIFSATHAALLKDDRVTAPPSLDLSVNIISNNLYERIGSAKQIQRLVFVDGVNTLTEYVEKASKTRPVAIDSPIRFSVGLSKERFIEKFAASNNSLVRFKVRTSFPMGRWRVDLTAVKQGQFTDLSPHFKGIRNDLFLPGLTPQNILERLNFSRITAYEVEVEYVGRVEELQCEDLGIANTLAVIINPNSEMELAYQDEIYNIAKLIHEDNKSTQELFRNQNNRLKQLSNQVVSISKTTYYSTIYPAHGYLLTDKADGVRAIVSLSGNRVRLVTSNGLEEKLDGVHTAGAVTVADAELVGDTLYLFDVIAIKDYVVANKPMVDRIGYLQEAAKLISAVWPNVRAKEYIRLNRERLEHDYRAVWEGKHPYALDGLIISEAESSYTQTHNYKWKPYDMNTIDFLAVKCPPKSLGVSPYNKCDGLTLYFLFVGISHRMRERLGIGLLDCYRDIFSQTEGQYYPIQFSVSAAPFAYIYYHDAADDINNKIVELSLSREGKWKFHRTRTDRKLEKGYYGNDYRVAELTYTNYVDPFEFEDLWSGPTSYFTKTADSIYTAPNRFKRYVISLTLKNYLAKANWVVDEAAGRGADLHRYQEIGVNNALFIDVDKTAIAELITRKFSYFETKKKPQQKRGGVEIDYAMISKMVVKDVRGLTAHTLVANLKTRYVDLLSMTYQYGITPGTVDGVVCNFALHYMCDTIENMRNILVLNSKLLKVGGVFIFTVMDGAEVFKLLAPYKEGEQWEVREGGVLKYAFRKLYSSDKLLPTGQAISVLLPLSDKMIEEPLCNVDALVSESTRLGFALELDKSMSEYLSHVARLDRYIHERLTDDDKKYISLHRVVALRLVKRVH